VDDGGRPRKALKEPTQARAPQNEWAPGCGGVAEEEQESTKLSPTGDVVLHKIWEDVMPKWASHLLIMIVIPDTFRTQHDGRELGNFGYRQSRRFNELGFKYEARMPGLHFVWVWYAMRG